MTDRRYMYAEAVEILTAAETEDEAEYITGDGEKFSNLQAALDYANGVAARTGQIIAVEKYDPFADPYWNKPWGEQQEQVDWLESRYDDQYEGENDYYGGYDD